MPLWHTLPCQHTAPAPPPHRGPPSPRVHVIFLQATLSGAMDVIAVLDDDGTVRSTPFHVRFGMFKVGRPAPLPPARC